MTQHNTASWILNRALPAPSTRRTGHDPLCLTITRDYTPPMQSCWCKCSKCWDVANQRCICRSCPCPNSNEGMGPEWKSPTFLLGVRPSERVAGRNNPGHTPGMPTTSKIEAGRTAKGPRPGSKRGVPKLNRTKPKRKAS